jgi:hypothetical protein
MSLDSNTSSAPASSDSSSSSDSFENDSFDNTPEQPDDDRFEDAPAEPKEPKAKPKQEAKSDPKKEEEKPQKRFIQTKINGKDVSVGEDELIRHYQKERAAEERFQKASQIEKNAQALIEAIRQDPAKVLKDPRLGVDMRAFAMKVLSEQVEEEILDPKDREARDLKARLADYEEREARDRQSREEKEHAERHERVVNERKVHFQQTFEKAMELSPLTRDPETAAAAVREMALHYRLAKSNGYEPTPEELAESVNGKSMKGYHSVASQLSGDELLSFLGDSIIKKIRQADLARLRGRADKPTTKQVDSWDNEPSKQGESKFIDPNELRQKFRS